jgi:hypothetical protein
MAYGLTFSRIGASLHLGVLPFPYESVVFASGASTLPASGMPVYPANLLDADEIQFGDNASEAKFAR